ncbi:hypothetical protein PFISCL1PPCAC_20237, partial [Pristionchus fissidentatus]
KMVEARDVNKADDEEFENDSGGTMAKSKIKSRDLKWKRDEDSTSTVPIVRSTEVCSDEAKSTVPRVVEAREVNKADDEEFENDSGGTMAKSKIKSRDLQYELSID